MQELNQRDTGHPRFPAAPWAAGTAAPIPYGPSQPNLYTQGAAPHCHPPDLPKRRGGGAGPHRRHLEGIGTLTGITKRSWSRDRDLNWEGKQEHGAAAALFRFFLDFGPFARPGQRQSEDFWQGLGRFLCS